MAANVGPGKDEDSDDLITEINITPMVDIMLVLLIIFMVTATYIVRPSIEINLPKATQADKVVQSTLGLSIKADGTIFLDGKQLPDQELVAQLRKLVAQNKEIQAIIAGDSAVPHGKVVRLIDLLRQVGITKFAINVQVEKNALGALNPNPISK